MNINSKHIILFVALLITLVSVVSATDINDTIISSDVTTSTISQDTQQTDTNVITESNNNNEIKNTQKAINTIVSEKNSGQTRNTTPTVWNLSNANFSNIVTSNGLNSAVNNGDILNFTTDVTRTDSSYIIDKPVTILGNQYTLNLNTGLNYAKTSLNFVSGASNSNITGLNLLNTQVYVNTSSNITFDNIHAKVNNTGVGAGVGSFAIRDGSINVTVKNSYFETYANGGYSTLVLTWSKNCTIENNTVYGTGNVGNLVYLNNYGGKVNDNGIVNNSGNTIKDNTITAVDPGMFCYALTITGANNSIINNTISNNRNYSVTTSWAGSYEETNPGDTHNVSYHGNKYINNTINGRFSTGNYSIVEGNWINGTSTIVGHANVTNNTFLGPITINNNVRFHSNNATGQTVTVILPDSCFKNSTIGTLHLNGTAKYTYNCGENTITSYYNKKYFKTCNGNCPNCESTKSLLLSKKTAKNLKTSDSEIVYQDDSCVVYSNGTAIVNENSCVNNYISFKSKFTNSNLNELDGVTDVYLYLNSVNWQSEITTFDVDLGKDKSNINLKIIFNTTGNTLSHGFNFSDMGYKFVTYENCNFLKSKTPINWNYIESWGINSNLKFINCTFEYQNNGFHDPNSAYFYVTELYDGDGWDMGETVNCMSIVGENISFNNCNFYLQTVAFDIDEEDPDMNTYTNIIVFNNSKNVTFNKNNFDITTFESSSNIDVSLYGPFLNRTVNNLKFINNDVNIRFVRGMMIQTNNSIIENNTITVLHADNTINITGDNNIVRYNTLTAGENEGDATVIVTGENNIVEQNPRIEGPVDYYVSDSEGSDSNDGSEGSPFKTIQTAIDKTDDANIYNIHILEGIYKGVGNTNLTVPGTNNINFIGAGINKTVLDGEAKFTIPGEGSVWGGSGFWNSWSNTSGNWMMNISAGEGVINIQNMTFQNSWANSGSSIVATIPTIDNHATLNVSNVYFYSNHAGNGAGIRNNYDGTLYVDNCIFENNTKSSTTGNYGAAVYNNGTAVITNSQIVRNFARWGSVTNDKNITLINCTFEGNGAYDATSGYKNGPSFAADTGISNHFMPYAVYNLTSTLINCTFNDNDQCDISNGRGDLYVEGCVFNHSTGIYLFPNNNKQNTYVPTEIITGNTFVDMQPSTVFATLITSTTPSVGVRALSSYNLTIENNNIDVAETDYSYGLYLTANATVRNNTLNDYIYLSGADNNIINNTINTNKQNTISLTNNAANAVIKDNTLYSRYTAGDLSVGNVMATTTLENNKPETNIYEINDDNYATYFDNNNVLKTDIVGNGSKITFVNNLTNKKFIFDNVKVAVDVNTTLINTTIVTQNNAQVLFNNLKISNAKTDEDYVILLESENNTIKNGNINITTDKPVQVIKVEEDGNVITGTTINATIPASDVVWNSDYSIGNVPTAGIFIRSSNNKVNNTRIYLYSTEASADSKNPTVDGIDIQSKKVGEYVTGNEIRSSRINVTGGKYVYGLNIARAQNTITPLSYFDVTSTYYAAAIQIGDSKDNNISGYIYAKADDTAYGYYSTAMASGITNNTNVSKLYIQNMNAPNAVGARIEGASNTLLGDATFTINGENVKAIEVEKDWTGNIPENISITKLTVNLNGENDTSSIATFTDASNVFINNSKINSAKGQGIILSNTNQSTVTNNYINVGNLTGGDNAVTSDTENTICNNTPNIGVLTDETYPNFFDENNTLYVDVDIITLGGDLHDKVLIFNNHTKVIQITNADNYTMYNSTLILEGNGTYSDRYGFSVENINFNNTNKPVFIDRFNGTGQKNAAFKNCNIYVTGDDIVAFDAFNNESYVYLDIQDCNITMDGKNVIAIDYAGYNRGQPAYINDNNINITATESAIVFNAKDAAIQFNKNTVEVNAPDVVVANLINSTISYYNFRYNDIKVNATTAMVLNMTKADTTTAYISDNEIYVTAKEPSTLININGTRTVHVQDNIIVLNTTNGETPVIIVTNPSSSVDDNFVMSNDLYGPEAVNATSQSDNTPLRTTINMTAPTEANVFDEITINVTATNATTSDGMIVLKINDEIVANSTDSELIYKFTPESNETLNIVAEYVYTQTGFVSSTANATITLSTLNDTLTLDVNRPFLNENLTVSGTLTDEKGNPIINATVTIDVNGKKVNVTTDTEGKYNYTTKPIEGNNTITVNFDGKNAYIPKEETTTTFVVDLDKYAKVDELNQTVQEQNQTIKEQEEIIDELNKTLKTQNNTIKDLEKQLNDAKNNITSLNNQIKTLNDKINNLNKENKDLTDKLNNANNKTAQQEKQIQDLNKEVSDLNDKIKNLTTKTNTKITVNKIATTKYGDKVSITGTLTDANNKAINNGVVTVTLNSGSIKVVTNSKGVYSYTTANAKVGTNNVTVTYAATDKYNKSTAKTTFKTTKANPTLKINTISSVKFKDQITITGSLIGVNSKVISGAQITLKINTKTVTVKTAKDGSFTYTTKATSMGTNNVTATYKGNTYYNKATKKATFKVTKQDLILTVDRVAASVKFKDDLAISGKLVDGNKKAVMNTQVTIKINNKTYKAKTDKNGQFVLKTRATIIGTNNVVASYAGNAKYNKATAKTTFKVAKQDLLITYDAVTYSNGKLTVKGTFIDRNKRPLMNSVARITLNGKQGTSKTNKQGTFTYTTKTNKGAYKLTLAYPGNTNYNAYSKTSTINVA